VTVLLVSLVAVASLARLDTVPAPFWDEGWTLLTARNWVERGHYGQLLDGRPRPAGLSADLSVVAPIALSFKLFGVGIWQGRLPGVACTAGALALVGALAGALGGRAAAWAALGVALLVTYPDPVTVGRHALAEAPGVFYLLAGYALARPALRCRPAWLVPAALAWALALAAKAQVLPFWGASIAATAVVAVARGWYGAAASLLACAGGAWAGRHALGALYRLLLRGLSEPPVEGLYAVAAAVTTVRARSAALWLILTYAAPALLGLAYGGWRLLRDLRAPAAPDRLLLRVGLWTLAASWLAWFALLAPAWPRYLFPPAFLAAPFVAALLSDLTGGFDLAGSVRRVRGAVASGAAAERARAVALVLALALVVAGAGRTVAEHAFAHADRTGEAVHRAAAFLNARTAPAALVETYDPELMFLLDRRYHYPPDQIHVELNRRTFLDVRTPIPYDPLAARPDYLVAGPLPRLWGLYDPVIRTPALRPVASFGDYRIYAHVSP
jgi:hypothetical protein